MALLGFLVSIRMTQIQFCTLDVEIPVKMEPKMAMLCFRGLIFFSSSWMMEWKKWKAALDADQLITSR